MKLLSFVFSILFGLLLCPGFLIAGPPANPFSCRPIDTSVGYDLDTGQSLASAFVKIVMQERISNPGFPNQVVGFSMGIVHDSAYLAVLNVETSMHVNEGELGGLGPDFFAVNPSSQGLTVGVVYSLEGFFILESTAEVLEIEYAVDASTLQGNPNGVTTEITWSNSLGLPPVQNVVVVSGGFMFPLLFTNGAVDILPALEVSFIRGDCNNDSQIDIADGIFQLMGLFVGAPLETCTEACNVNADSAGANIADTIELFTFLFTPGGPPPAHPFPNCGRAPGTSCQSSACP